MRDVLPDRGSAAGRAVTRVEFGDFDFADSADSGAGIDLVSGVTEER
jgi:hypothetical protein